MQCHESTNVCGGCHLMNNGCPKWRQDPIARVHLTRQGLGRYRVDVYRPMPEGFSCRSYHIWGDGYAMDTLMHFIGHHRYTIEYANNSISTPMYILHERTW